LRTGLDNGPPEKSRAWRARQPKKNIKTAGWYIGYITAGCNLARSKEKIIGKKKENRKGNGKKRNEGSVSWVFRPLIDVTQPGEAVLPNVSLKLIQLHQRIRFTSTATATAVPNAP
jgi:hypothetical protein